MFPYILFLPLMGIYTPDFVFCPTLQPPETTSPSFNYFTPHPLSNTRHCVLNSIFSSYQLNNSTPYLSSMWDSFKIIDLLCESHLIIGLSTHARAQFLETWFCPLILSPTNILKWPPMSTNLDLFPNALIGLVLYLSHTWRSLLPFPKAVS